MGGHPHSAVLQVPLSGPKGYWRAVREHSPVGERSGSGAVGATKLEVELQLVVEPLRGARKKEAWELPHPLGPKI